MFFNSADEIEKIALGSGCTVFEMPSSITLTIKNAIILQPEEKTTITIEQVREVLSRLSVRQVADRFVIIRPADKLGLEAANALLKNLEEPGEKVHFVLVTEAASQLLPTILSRANLYILKQPVDFKVISCTDAKIKEQAKRLMVAKPADLIPLAEELTKKKDGVRARVLEVVGVAIEMLYKTYFLTEKPVFLEKLPKFLKLYENLAANGHIKLHLVADLL